MRPILAASLGNALEFYDFTVFAFFAIAIGNAFFPATDPYLSLMASLATFWAGYISRPIGAWVLGRYGDRVGRGPAMLVSMLLMGVANLMLVLCPGYATIGIAAPIVAVVARLLQGVALGGEVGPATALMLEWSAEGRRGLVLSLQRGTQLLAAVMGSLVGLALSAIMPAESFDLYGWRIALGLGVLIVPYAIIIRRNLPDHPEVQKAVAAPPPPGAPRFEPGLVRTIVCGCVMMSGVTIVASVLLYMTTFAQSALKLSAHEALAGQTVSNVIALAACFAGGALSDRIGRRATMIWPTVAAIIVGPALFGWMVRESSFASYVIAISIYAGITSLIGSPLIASIIESLPTRVRSGIYALVYTVPITIFGGSAQFVVTWLVHRTGAPMAVIWYATGAGCVALAGMLAIRESAPGRRSAAIDSHAPPISG
ncbi:MAG: MFS transporter [Pseudomonadota bacterium]